jgi:hypothetical protein
MVVHVGCNLVADEKVVVPMVILSSGEGGRGG